MNDRETERKRRRDMKRVRVDAARDMRDVQRLDSAFIVPDSEIQLVEGGIVADRDEYGVYAELIFRNLSDEALKSLKLRFDFYYYQNIPYLSTYFEYSGKDITFGKIKNGEKEIKKPYSRTEIKSGETFGEGVYIPMPESPYTRLGIYICGLAFCSGRALECEISLCGKGIAFSELDEVTKRILKGQKQFIRNEAVFPTKNLPQFSENGWLCCCGYKNRADSDACEKCLRGRELQRSLISEPALVEKKNELANEPTAVLYHDKSRFAQSKYLQNRADREKREEEIKRSQENLRRQEEEKRKRESHWLKRSFVVYCVFVGMFFLIVLFCALVDGGRDSENFWWMFHRIAEGDKSLFEFFGFGD